jgi:hypothetical protein
LTQRGQGDKGKRDKTRDVCDGWVRSFTKLHRDKRLTYGDALEVQGHNFATDALITRWFELCNGGNAEPRLMGSVDEVMVMAVD